MSEIQQNNGVGPKTSGNEPARKSVVAVVMVICVLTLVGAVIYSQRSKSPSQPPVEVTSPGNSNQEQPQLVQNDPNKANVVQWTGTQTTNPPGVSRIVPKVTTPAVAVDPNRPQPAPQMRQLVKTLTDLDFKNSPMTPEKAAEW